MAYTFKEAPYWGLVNYLVILIVYSFKSSPDAETLESFQVLFELLEAQFEVDLLGQQNRELFFYQRV